MDLDFPHRKQLDAERFAYIVPLTYGRARINIAQMESLISVDDGW